MPGKRSDHVVGLGQQIPADLSGEQRVVLKYDDAILNGVGNAALLCFVERLQDPKPALFLFGIYCCHILKLFHHELLSLL